MRKYGKEIIIHDEFDGYDDVVYFCDRCGEECSDLVIINPEYEVCKRCFREWEDELIFNK